MKFSTFFHKNIFFDQNLLSWAEIICRKEFILMEYSQIWKCDQLRSVFVCITLLLYLIIITIITIQQWVLSQNNIDKLNFIEHSKNFEIIFTCFLHIKKKTPVVFLSYLLRQSPDYMFYNMLIFDVVLITIIL